MYLKNIIPIYECAKNTLLMDIYIMLREDSVVFVAYLVHKPKSYEANLILGLQYLLYLFGN